MSFTTLSAVLRGQWLIDKAFATTQLPLIAQMLKGQSADGDASAVYKNRLAHTQNMSIPRKRALSAVKSDIYSVTPYTSTDRLPYNSIAMLDIIGPVLKYGDYCAYGTVEYNDLLIRLANSGKVKGVILNIDSPGGQADGTAMFAATIKDVSKVIPVIAVIQDGIAASAAMWIASAAQEIYLTQATDQLGSIGAYTTIYDFSGWFEQNGIKVNDIYAPQSGDKNKGYHDAIKGDETLIKEDLGFLVQNFIKTVQTNRGQRLNTTSENPFTGKMYNAADAVKIGLADGIKPLTGVVKRLEQLISLRA